MVAADLNDYLVNRILGAIEEGAAEEDGPLCCGKGGGVVCNEWGSLLLYDQVSPWDSHIATHPLTTSMIPCVR